MNLLFFVHLACLWEATARKPGNVHRFADSDDVTYLDFLTSAAAIGPVLGGAARRPVGETVLQCVQATRKVARTNTNLGIILLLAPLCAVPEDESVDSALPGILRGLTVDDSRLVYEAIRLARPGGLGKVPEQDVHAEPSLPLQEVMALAAERDRIARQYVNGFRDVREIGGPALLDGLARFGALEPAIIHCHLWLLAQFPDSLISRKRGPEEAAKVMRWAAELFRDGWETATHRSREIAALDRWLRGFGCGRNPGTTADLVTACLFLALREGKITLPLPFPWSGG
jgi:triphosphoribosyl-dephospho-CoA synthase